MTGATPAMVDGGVLGVRSPERLGSAIKGVALVRQRELMVRQALVIYMPRQELLELIADCMYRNSIRFAEGDPHYYYRAVMCTTCGATLNTSPRALNP